MPAALDQQKEWLSLQEASERLGVSPATLRLWADRGRVHAFRTPGGHRRFRREDLAALTAGGEAPGTGQPLRVLAHAALGRARFELSEGWLDKEAWYAHFPEGAREAHRELGRRVIRGLSDLMSTTEPEEALDRRARELGRAYGELNRKYDISLSDALRAFLFFRDSFVESLVELAKTAPALDTLALMRQTNRFVDRMLLTMVESYAPRTGRKRRSI